MYKVCPIARSGLERIQQFRRKADSKIIATRRKFRCNYYTYEIRSQTPPAAVAAAVVVVEAVAAAVAGGGGTKPNNTDAATPVEPLDSRLRVPLALLPVFVLPLLAISSVRLVCFVSPPSSPRERVQTKVRHERDEKHGKKL